MYLTDDCQDVGEMDTDVQPGSREESGSFVQQLQNQATRPPRIDWQGGALNCSRLGSPAALRLGRGCLDGPHQSSHE